jgi:hypothetical protein
VDHQIQHDIDVSSALYKRSQAMTLNELGFADYAFQPPDRGVEPLQVANLKHEPFLSSKRDQFLPLFQRRRERLFHQDIDARYKKIPRHFVVRTRRNGNADTTNSAA